MIYADLTKQCERYAELGEWLDKATNERGLADALASDEANEFRGLMERLIGEFERRGIFGPHHEQPAKYAMLQPIVRVWLEAQRRDTC